MKVNKYYCVLSDTHCVYIHQLIQRGSHILREGIAERLEIAIIFTALVEPSPAEPEGAIHEHSKWQYLHQCHPKP